MSELRTVDHLLLDDDAPEEVTGRCFGRVTVLSKRHIEAPAARAVAVVQDLASLPLWEHKARRVTVHATDPYRGTYSASGRLVGLIPWSAEFDYELTDTGMHSKTSAGRGIQVRGGFRVTPHCPESCTIVHYEHYMLPVRARAALAAWRWYIARTMAAELDRIALLAPDQRGCTNVEPARPS